MSSLELLKRPSAYLPVFMSCVALATVLGSLAVFGVARESDEGVVAHVFQLLMVAQVPVIAIFAIKWLPRDPRHVPPVLALQAVAALSALAPVFILGL